MQDNYFDARGKMVDCQLRPEDVSQHGVLQAFYDIPREAFVLDELKPLAYLDENLEIAPNRFLLEAAPLAKLIQAAQIGEEDVVLDIGCNCGYSSAVLSRLANMVIGLEENADLAKMARENIEAETADGQAYSNVAIVEGALEEGHAAEAPYDAIILQGSVDQVPETLLEQLKDGGRLVAVTGSGNAAQARLFVRFGSDFSNRPIFNCAIPALPGFARKAEFVF